MPTPSDTLRVLEWGRIQEQLAALACTPQGRIALSQLEPLAGFDRQVLALEFAGECLALLDRGESLPLRKIEDLEPLLERAAPEGARLEGAELARAGDFCLLCTELAGCAKALPENSVHLRELLLAITPQPDFARAAAKALDSDGTVREDATPQLARLFRSRRELERDLLARLEKTAQSISSDSVVTVREGRYVISVPEQKKSTVPGIVHDRSQSGATYFIEPLSILDGGNRLRSADADIRDEIAAILLSLSVKLRSILPALKENLRVTEELDLVWTKSRWAAGCGGRVPQRSRDSVLDLRDARHPLLLKQHTASGRTLSDARAKVVPFRLTLGPGRRSLVISGPNTGGKTVCLKSVGLSLLLVQAGVPPPLSSDSVVGDFDAVFADIGDDQSLMLSLSTFSAHLKHVGEACRHATERSLVLLDELGVGTDPEEGGALALAVLEALLERGVTVVVTTHHPALKSLDAEDQVVHAAFAFHEASLSPTYELVAGRPGRSYALDVASRLGFPLGVVERARSLVSQPSRDLSSLLDRLSKKELELKDTQERLAEKESRVEELLDYNRQEEARWRKLSKRAEAEAKSNAATLVQETRREVERLVKELRTQEASPEAVRATHRGLEELSRRTRSDADAAESAPAGPGDRVRITDLGAEGEVQKVSSDGQRVSVRIGNVTYTVSPDRLALLAREKNSGRPKTLSPSVSSAPAEVDVRGLSADEAVFEVDSALQALASAGGTTLRVIHGLGTGVLRREITSWLKRRPEVASYRKGEPGEGSSGVTVISLKS